MTLWGVAHQAPQSMGCHFLLKGVFPTQGSNPGLLHWQADSLMTVPPGKPPGGSNGRERVRTEFSLALGLWADLNMSLATCSAPACEAMPLPFLWLPLSLHISPSHWSWHPIMSWDVTAGLKHGAFQRIGLSRSATVTVVQTQACPSHPSPSFHCTLDAL